MPRYHTPGGPTPPEQQNPLEMTNRAARAKEIGNRINSVMMEKGWRQSELARRAEIPRDSVSTYIRGKSVPSPQNLRKIAEALSVRPEDLMPNYVEQAAIHSQTAIEMRGILNDAEYLWLKLNMRLPRRLAVKIFSMIEDWQSGGESWKAS